MSHPNAFLARRGRIELAKCIVEDGWPLRRAAERFQVSVPTAARWASRYRELGEDGMEDLSSRPSRSPRRTPARRERRIIALRVNRRWGPARIGYLLGIHPSTVHKVLSRYRLARLSWLDRATGRVIRRYEHQNPGDMVHVDIKKLGRIPDGGGHRVTGRAAGNRNKTGTNANRRPGYAYLHNAVDDHSRFAYTEILSDEKKETAAGFWERANAAFNAAGITVSRVLTDNGSCYRSRVFAQALGADIKHKRTRPYRPQTNGKVERFNRTMLDEWAYAKPYASEAERVAAFPAWLHHYNHNRGHTSLKGQPPASRVTNLRG
ncbi:transposase InsO family protein [Arthrobacter sp. V4I6]|uniref:IS481 family transposase n=1 Tax=unclassified Arthrobacter TaxID=235627 RepID=UPI0027876DF9|nr:MULTISPECIES: IS481 family transposase [unclassified Arthrobacter]MDQ0820028.1 transposase InsO family protein [Arthrobacter sp. V1I7]MDQ0820511.1 transposase InsO family protein [Arthrobacter sp. V1I7]MDQ0820739.1 transposase InsO family protein [Arthrobacter sp. V1I7]MDQ0821460.1 transposase InsO family protein [Arthrobacter sp. V1I7]MDQ0822979.1 transposase InsO family protein [Arthrobacter sp. V1I7]